MFLVPDVVWVVSCSGSEPPGLVRRCPGCGPVPHLPTGAFRVNASGHRLDVWLLYRCAGCDRAWKRPVHERVAVRDVPHLRDYEKNDPERVLAIASTPFPGTTPIESPVEVVGPAWDGTVHWRVGLRIPSPIAVRLDRVAAIGLGWSRSRLRRAVDEGRVSLEGPRAWSAPATDGTVIRLRSDTDVRAAILDSWVQLDTLDRAHRQPKQKGVQP